MKAFLFKTILNFSKSISLKNNRAVAKFIGWIVWRLSKKNKSVTLTNISRCYPNLSDSQQTDLAKQTINATLMNMLELGKLWDKKIPVEDFVQNIYGMDDFKKALQDNNGLLLAAPHMGNWETLNLVLAQFENFAFLYKPPNDTKIEQMLVAFRGKSKALQIEANRKGVRKIMLHLKEKGFIAILPDQRPKDGQGVFTPFYGIPTYTMSLFSRLAIKTKVPVFFAYALRTEKGFDVYFEKSDNLIYSDLKTSITYMNQHIQSIVDKAPEQYQWTYRRFSIQPDGVRPFY